MTRQPRRSAEILPGGFWLDDGANEGNLRAEVRLRDGANNKFIDRGFRIAAAARGTSPPPSVSGFGRHGSTFTLSMKSLTGFRYQLEWADSPGASFTPMGAARTGSTGTVLTFEDPNAAEERKFYRISITESP